MPQYMLLLYSSAADDADTEARRAEMPVWLQVTDSLRQAGVLVGNAPLHAVDTATTVRLRADEVELVDGPFAITKEVLVGYYLLDCLSLDEALKHAARLPIARYGCVEVRPVRDLTSMLEHHGA
jgi:hypothetical protein